MRIAESGYRFFHLLQGGASLRDADLGSLVTKDEDLSDLYQTPTSSIEKCLAKATSMAAIEKACSSTKFNDMFDESRWPIATHTTRHAINEFNNGRSNSYLYYFLVGLTLIARSRRLQYCGCCGWRLKPVGNGRYCPPCSTTRNKHYRGRTTSLRQQRKILAALKHSKEYKAFMKLRDKGQDYPLLMLMKHRYERIEPLPCDPTDDFTPDKEYRQAKLALAKRWNDYEPNARSRRVTSTDAALLLLASKGLSKSEAAESLGISKSGVTKSCQRSAALAAAFQRGNLKR